MGIGEGYCRLERTQIKFIAKIHSCFYSGIENHGWGVHTDREGKASF